MDLVTLRGVNQRGKNRVREHGPTFAVIHRSGASLHVRCIKPGCPCLASFPVSPACPSTESINFAGWGGWLEIGSEVEVIP